MASCPNSICSGLSFDINGATLIFHLDNFSIPEYAAVKYIILARFSMFLEYPSWLNINTSLSRYIKIVSIEGHIQKNHIWDSVQKINLLSRYYAGPCRGINALFKQTEWDFFNSLLCNLVIIKNPFLPFRTVSQICPHFLYAPNTCFYFRALPWPILTWPARWRAIKKYLKYLW